jgi:hypothetical protein
MKVFNSLKSIPRLELALFIIFILYIIFPLDTPKGLAPYVDSPLGIIVIFCVTVYLFLYTNPILAVLYIFVAYELLRRSSNVNARSAIIEYTPTQQKKDTELKEMNPSKDKTLEEEMVEIRAPLGSDEPPAFVSSSFKPVADKVIQGTSMV